MSDIGERLARDLERMERRRRGTMSDFCENDPDQIHDIMVRNRNEEIFNEGIE